MRVCLCALLTPSFFQPAASCLIGVCIDWSSFSLFSVLYFGRLMQTLRNPLAFAKTALTAPEAFGKIALNG